MAASSEKTSDQSIPSSQDLFNQLLETAVAFSKDGKYNLAISNLDEAIKHDESDPSTRDWYYFYRAQWKWMVGDYDEALRITNEGISITGSSPKLLYQKADILYRASNDNTAVQNLLTSAEEFFDATVPEFNTLTGDTPSQFKSLEAKIKNDTQFKTAINTLRLQSLIKNAELVINDKVATLETKLEKERVNVIEIISIFTAVMSLIILGGSFAVKLSMVDALKLFIGLGVILASFTTITSHLFIKNIGVNRVVHEILLLIFSAVVLLLLMKN